MSSEDDERRLRDAFGRLRAEEERSAPTLAQLVARAERARAPRTRQRAWQRLALPLAGASAAALALWLALGAGPGEAPPRADASLAQLEAALAPSAERAIPLGSLRSPTDALLAPPLAALGGGEFSRSLIPAPPVAAPASGDRQSRTPLTRRPLA
jgi:hypothetical protein